MRIKQNEYIFIMNRFSFIAISGLFLLLSACSFNKQFLHPYKIPAQAEKINVVNNKEKDTLLIRLERNKQPVFTNLQNDTLEPGYQVESVFFEHPDKHQLHGWIMSPDSAWNGITILFFHGNAGNIFTQYTEIVPLINQGFKVFLFDYSGFGFSEGKATRDNILQDAYSALSYAENRKELNTGKLILYGQSLGGHLALVVAARKQESIDGVVTEGAFSSHRDIASERSGFFGRMLVAEKYSGVKAVQKYKKPLLVIHSTNDEVVPFQMGRKLFNHANEPKYFYAVDKCHTCAPLFYADSISSKIFRMLNQ